MQFLDFSPPIIPTLDQQRDALQKGLGRAVQLGQMKYFHTPCEMCRFYAARMLQDRNVTPAWMSEECRLDSNEDCRSLFEPHSDRDYLNSKS